MSQVQPQSSIKYPNVKQTLKGNDNVYALIYAVETAMRVLHVSETERDSFLDEILNQATSFEDAKTRMSQWITITWT